MSSAFDNDIASAVPIFSSHPEITRAMKIPKYRDIFDATHLGGGGGFQVSFKPTFANDMRKMVVESENANTGRVIRALGYGWINGLLASSGLFNPATKNGIWLAATFAPGPDSFPAVRVPSLNDGPSAQATTCFDMANMFALIFEKDKIDGPSTDSVCNEMQQLLQDAAGFDPSWLVKRPVPPGQVGLSAKFRATHAKIGVGSLNAVGGGLGPAVLSEAIILKHVDSNKRFIVVWQDTVDTVANINGLVFLFERTIKNFLGLP